MPEYTKPEYKRSVINLSSALDRIATKMCHLDGKLKKDDHEKFITDMISLIGALENHIDLSAQQFDYVKD